MEELIKAFPFVCSRTKNQDFIIDYLVRPEDFNWREAKAFVSNAMYDLSTLNDFRYAVFAVDKYCVFGVGCLSRFLVEKVKFEIDQDYLRDEGRRSLACFIGFAVKISETDTDNANVPDMVSDDFLKQCCEMYFKHLKKQWLKSVVVSEQIDESGISSLDSENCFVSLQQIRCEINKVETENTYRDINIIQGFDKNWLSYYLDNIINKGNIKESFISNINYQDQWERLVFKNASVSAQLKSSIPKFEMAFEKKETNGLIKLLLDLMNEYYEFLKKFKDNLPDYSSKKIEIDNCQKDFNIYLKGLKIKEAEGNLNHLKSLFKEDNTENENIKKFEAFEKELSNLKQESEKLKFEENKKAFEEKCKPLEGLQAEINQNIQALEGLANSIKISELETRYNNLKTAYERLMTYKYEFEQHSEDENELERILGKLNDFDCLNNQELHNRVNKLMGEINHKRATLQTKKEKQNQAYRSKQSSENSDSLEKIFNDFESLVTRINNCKENYFADVLFKFLKSKGINPEKNKCNFTVNKKENENLFLFLSFLPFFEIKCVKISFPRVSSFTLNFQKEEVIVTIEREALENGRNLRRNH